MPRSTARTTETHQLNPALTPRASHPSAKDNDHEAFSRRPRPRPARPRHARLSFDFQDHPGPLGNTQVFSSKVSPTGYSSTYQITANGLNGTASTDLFVKSSGGGESGLGIKSDHDHEIAGTNSVDLNFTDLKRKLGITSLDFLISSVQPTESYFITGGSLSGPVIAAGTGRNGTVTVSGTNLAYDDFFVHAGNGNVLIETVTVNGAVPEPASLAMTALGVGATLVCARLRRRKAAKA